MCTVAACRTDSEYEWRRLFVTNQVMRITLNTIIGVVDASAAKIIDTVKKNGATVSGPVPASLRRKLLQS